MKMLGGAAVLMALTGCVSAPTKTMSQESTAQLSGKTVTSSQYVKPDFTAMTAGKAMFGMIGAVAMISAGNEIVRENGVADPALAISSQLTAKLQQKGMVTKENTAVATSDDLAPLAGTYGGSDYLIDVKTVNWNFVYYPTDWSHYKVMYVARIRLIDVAHKSVAGQVMCSSTQENAQHPPTKDELLANRAELLKSYLSKAGNECVTLASSQVLSL
jgi:hypothetical protein